jgi:hypothetical protein
MLTWPVLLKPLAGGFAPAIKSLTGGQSLAGIEQVVSQMNDRWKASFRFRINSTETLLALRSFVIAMRGRANTVNLPVFDRSRAPWALEAVTRRPISPATRRSRRLDGTPYADADDFNDTLLTAVLGVAADLNDTSVNIQMQTGSAPQLGHYLSMGGNRLYMIVASSLTNPNDFQIWPPLRDDFPIGAPVNFASPSCEMRFASDDQGAAALAEIDQMRFASVTLAFDEAAPVKYTRELREDGGFELRD